MTLTPLKTPIFKSSDPDFNYRAAQDAFDLVMKMDEDTARVFTEFVVADVLEETIEKNLDSFQRRLNKVISKRIEIIKKATLRAAANGADESSVAFAKALAQYEEVTKATPYDYGYVFRESDFRRDPGTGRFRTKVSHSQKTPLKGKTAAAMGIPKHDKNKEMTPQQRAQFQDEYRQLANFLSAVNNSGGQAGDTNVLLHLRDRATGQTYTTMNNGTKPNEKAWDPTREQLVGIDAKPNTLTAGSAAFGLTTALGGDVEAGNRRGHVIDSAGANMGSFKDNWLNAGSGDEQNGTSRAYGRVVAGSQFLSQIAPAGSQLQMAAAFGQFVGSHGPEAEAVFGPPTRKMAYRYRGTEKTPDKEMVSEYAKVVQSAKQRQDPYARGVDRPVNIKNPRTRSVQQMAADRVAAERRAPTWQERGDGRAVIAAHLRERMPKAGLYNLQLASGNTPPSEGVIINANGQIASQAVGYGDDHYLPFNLKNLKELKGGEYIRTRSVGGPTSEDIHVGLMSGARQLTVISRSGTFVVEFNDDFRGGRRHNDKARRMTRRYEQILDAVQSQQVDRMDVAPEIRRAITQEVQEEMGGYGLSRAEMRNEITRRVDEFKSDPEISEADERLAELMVNYQTAGGTTRDANAVRAQVMNQIAAEKEYKFRLNGLGYAAGLEALREQFPYYITVRSQPTKDPERVELGIDRGYVEPGRNRPTAAQAGLYGTATNKGQKFSASQADYQGARGKKTATGALNPISEEKPAAKKADIQQVVAQAKSQAAFADAALAMQEQIKAKANLAPEHLRLMNLSAQELRDPANQREFDAFVRGAIPKLGNNLDRTVLNNYQRAAGHVGQTEYSPDRAGLWPDKPFAFSGEAFKVGATREREKKLMEIDRKTKSGVVHTKPLSAMTDAELKDEHTALNAIRQSLSVGAELDTADKIKLLAGIGVAQGSPGLTGLLASPGAVDARLEAVHQVRALQADTAEADRKAASAKSDPGDITVHHAIDPTKVSDSQQKAMNMVESIENAARFLEDTNGDETEIRRFRDAADAIRGGLADVHSQVDVDALRDANDDIIRRSQDLLYQRKRSQQ